MQTRISRRQWLSRNWLAVMVVGGFVLAWGGLMDLAISRSLGASLGWKPGQTMSLPMAFVIHALYGSPLALLTWLLFAIGMNVARRCIRWWAMLASISFLGTPIAFFGGRAFTRYIWSLNRGGVPWEGIVPVGVGALIGCFGGLVVDRRIDYLRRVRGEKWAALPSFGVAYVLSVVMLLTFVVWIVIDASFPYVLHSIRIAFGGGNYSSTEAALSACDVLGLRLPVFTIFTLVALMSLASIIARLFVGKRFGRSILGMTLATALVAAWLSLFISYDKLMCWGLELRVRRALPRFKKAAAHLLCQWPIQSGSLPEAGEYYVVSGSPERLFVPSAPSTRCVFGETFGPFIRRLKKGGIQFTLPYQCEWVIEYHPNDGPARPYRLSGTEHEVVEAIDLEPCWYLVRYRSLSGIQVE